MRKDIHHAAPMPQALATVYFGNDIPAGGRVTKADFDRFIEDSITPRFPGFTLGEMTGYWKGKPELVRVVTILGDDDSSFRTNVRIIAEHYKQDFGQEAVAYSFAPVEYTTNVWPFGPVATYHKPGKGY